MDLFAFDAPTMLSFLLTFMRVSLVVFLLPFFGGQPIPMQVKAAFCLVLTMALWPRLALSGVSMPAHPLELIPLLFSEMLLGLALGMAVHFLFAGIQTGGQLLGFQMGFTMITLADPLSGAQISITSHLLYMVSLLTFLALDGHLVLLYGFAESFTLIPAGALVATPAAAGDLINLAGDMFVIAVKIAAPVLVALFLVELALAIMARAAPQMNLLMIGFPLKIAVGFFFLGMLFTLTSRYIEEYIVGMPAMMLKLLRAMSPL